MDQERIAIVEAAAARLPDAVAARECAVIRAIAGAARQSLGRPAKRSVLWLDVGAVRAVAEAARQCGVPVVAQWAAPDQSLPQMARALVRRAIESGVGVRR